MGEVVQGGITGRIKETNPSLFSVVPWRKDTLKCRKFLLKVGWSNTGTAVQRAYGGSVLVGVKNWTGRGPEPPAVADPAFGKGGLDQMISWGGFQGSGLGAWTMPGTCLSA